MPHSSMWSRVGVGTCISLHTKVLGVHIMHFRATLLLPRPHPRGSLKIQM